MTAHEDTAPPEQFGTGLRAMLRSLEDNPMTLSEFLLARIAEDEARPHDEWCSSSQWKSLACDCANARVLVECEAKRRIVEWADAEVTCQHHNVDWRAGCADCYAAQVVVPMIDALMLGYLAPIYAGHADYREEWKP